jgi:8-oxo-dGTP pyrophosphatase MutT (NUDIX family)
VTALRDEALATLRAWHCDVPRQESLRQEYVDHLAAHTDGTDRSCPGAHVTAGALILAADRTKVLLTLHAKARRWFHMGGHLEPQDTSLAAAALREATEESGVQGLVLDPAPLHLDAHEVAFCGDHPSVRHLDVRFLALAPEGAAHVVTEESIDVRWWPVDALPSDAAELREMVDAALERAQAPSRTRSQPRSTSASTASSSRAI